MHGGRRSACPRWLQSVTTIAPSRVLGVDRGVDRRPEKSQCHVCIRGIAHEASLLVRRMLRTSVLLLIRWFRVRPPGAPPAVLIVFRVGSWTVENCSFIACRLSPSGHIEQLPSGSWRAKVCAGKGAPSPSCSTTSGSRKAPNRGRDQRGKTSHPPHPQARAGNQGSTQGPRPAAGHPLRAPAEVRRISGPPSAAGGPGAAARRRPARCTQPNRRRCPRGSARVAGARRRPSLPHPDR